MNPLSPASPKPSWLRVKAPVGNNYSKLSNLIKKERLHTVCSSASCPNVGECWNAGTATFMILGNICTRACRFCHVKSAKSAQPVDLDEPRRLAETIQKMALKHAVITSVTRDDLADYGATHFKNCLEFIKKSSQNITLEVLVPDFKNKFESIELVAQSPIQIYNHNIETVARLTKKIRSGALYNQSLETLRTAKQINPRLKTKTGIMLGLGEELDEVKQAILDARAHDVNILTIGQYLRPTLKHTPVIKYAPPDEFAELKTFAYQLGFSHVESNPLARSSYHAEKGV